MGTDTEPADASSIRIPTQHTSPVDGDRWNDYDVEELVMPVSFWLTAFHPEERESKFQQSLKDTRRLIVLVSTLVLGCTDLRAGLMSTMLHGPLAWETDWPLPTLFWLVNGFLHLSFATVAKRNIWMKVHLWAPNLLAFWVVSRFSAYSAAASSCWDRIEYDEMQYRTMNVAVVSALLCTPMMLALAVVNSYLLVFSFCALWVPAVLFFQGAWYPLTYLLGATVCVGLMSHTTVLRLRQAFVREELIKEVSQREIKSLEMRTVECAAAKLAQTRAEAYGDLVAATVHDLRSPLAALASGCRVLRRSYNEKNDDLVDCGEQRLRSASLDRQQHGEVLGHMDSAIGMNQQLLDSMSYSAALLRGESVSQEIGCVNVSELLFRALAVVMLSRPDVDLVEFNVEVANEIENIMTDDLVVSRNVLNLLGNAARHTQQGLIECSAVLDKTDAAQTWIKFAVTDTGSGGCTQLAHIWEPFVSQAGSTGLGLYVVKKQTEALGGVVGVAENSTSESGGSVFWFSLPYIPHGVNDSQVSSQAIPVAVSAQTSMKATNSQHTILLIDDIQFVAEAQAQVLRGEGFKVDIALGTAQGMQLLQQRLYTLVLCDYNMPGMTGAELTLHFRNWEVGQRDREFKQVIYALTGHRRQEVETECLAAGMQGVISKPIDCDCVLRVIRSIDAVYIDESETILVEKAS